LRIAHFTDIHIDRPEGFAWRDMLSKRILGWINLRILRRQADFAGSEAVLEALAADLRTVQPDHVISTGDFTALSFPQEFEAARRLLVPILDSSSPTVIPGNHDVYVRSAESQRLYERSFGSWIRTDLPAEEFPEDLRHLYPYPLVRLLGDRVAILCLRDVRPNPFHDSSGAVGKPQLRLLSALLDQAEIKDRVKILALHTGFLKAGGRLDGWYHRLKDWKELLDVAVTGGVSLIIHGHTHGRFVLRRGPFTPVPAANPGSLTCNRHARAYHVYTVHEPGRIEVEARRFDAAAGGFVPWPDAPGAGAID
jgi:3',5'-cyclic AMP phosphodiesterase CpdA